MSPKCGSEEGDSPGALGAGQYLFQYIPIKGDTLIVARRPPSLPESEEAFAEGEAADVDQVRLLEDPAQGKIARVKGEQGEYIVGLAFYQNFHMEGDPQQVDFSPSSSQVRFPAAGALEQAAVSMVAADTGAVSSARYTLGLDGLVVECCEELGSPLRARYDGRLPKRSPGGERYELLFLPSTQVDVDVVVARRKRPGLLRISGSWPTVCIHLLFPSRREALAAQCQLRAGVNRVINSLHTLVPCGAPPLTWAPLNDRPGPPYTTRGAYLLGGYVLHTERCTGEPIVSSLLWAELWGPNPFGYVRIYLYNNHRPNACYNQSLCWPKPHECNVHLSGSVVNIDYEDPEGNDHDPFTEEAMTYFAFRNEEEARLWLDIIASVYQNYAPRNEFEDLDCRIGELNRTLNEARRQSAWEEPLMQCSNMSIMGPRPDAVPSDEIAVEAREEREKEGLNILEEVARIKLNATIPHGMVATETTEILSM